MPINLPGLQKVFNSVRFKKSEYDSVPWLTLLTTSILALLVRISCSRACWHLLAASSPSKLAIEHTCVAMDTLSFSQDKVWNGQDSKQGQG